tara:strand:- start:236 stop:505 length:270 start_codon:yes stop_codon:yes gene_type:complete
MTSRQSVAETPYTPELADASQEGKQAIQGFQGPAGMTVSLFSAEPVLANPVRFCIHEQSRFYVAETFRQGKGVEDKGSKNRASFRHGPK